MALRYADAVVEPAADGSRLTCMETPGLTIVEVKLCGESMKSHRVLNDENPDLYPVVVYFSRPADEYERRELADFGIIREDGDGMCAIIWETTLEHVRDQLGKHNAALASAVARARETREAAKVEDDRLTALEAEINVTLRRAGEPAKRL